MTKSYRVVVASLPHYESVVAEIYVDDQFVGLLSQEDGPDQTLLELGYGQGPSPVKVRLASFEAALAEAKLCLPLRRPDSAKDEQE